MSNFLKFLKLIVGLPFFAIWAVLAALVGFLLHFIFTPSKNPKKEATKEDISKRKEQYKKTSKVIVIDDISQHLEASFNWDSSKPVDVPIQKSRQKKKRLAKRRKRRKLAKKSRQQNRK